MRQPPGYEFSLVWLVPAEAVLKCLMEKRGEKKNRRKE